MRELGQGSCLLAAQGLVQSDQKLNNLVALGTEKQRAENSPTSSHHLFESHKTSILDWLSEIKIKFLLHGYGGWVCSINLKNMTKATHYTRHFFIPLSWRTGESDAIVKIVSKTVLAFGRGVQLIVFHGFLEFEEKVAF